jgi:DNA polymerase I-like protein with 3'-5' exonuclease and polymerase domains
VVKTWRDDRIFAFDFETSGELPEYALQPWRVRQGKAWATSLVWAGKGEEGLNIRGGLEPDRDMIGEMLAHAIDEKATVVGWNTVFDIQWCMAYGFERECMAVDWLDGMLLWRHLFIEPEYEMTGNKRKSYGLKTAVKEYLPKFADYADEVDFHSTDPDEREKLHQYNVRDVVFTLRLARKFWKQLSDEQRQCASIEAKCLPMVARANLHGMVVDVLAARELEQYLVDQADHSLTLLQPLGVDEATVRSPVKLAKVMYDTWRLPVLKENVSKLTGKTTRSTDKEVLHELALTDPRAAEIRKYREALNNRTKFAAAPLAAAEYNADDAAHPAAIVFGTYSGRLTYASKQGKNKDERQTGFALHQEKRDKIFRSIILPPPGYTLVEFDASGQEFRWMAIASGDETMLQLCLPGEDPHSFMGSRIAHRDYAELIAAVKAGEPEAKEQRQLGKVGNLSLQYRTSAKKLRVVARVQYNIPMELPEANRIWTTYQRTYRGVPTYWNKQIAKTRRLGYVETFAGRRVQVVGNWDGSFGWSMGSTAINYRIQGTGADQKYLALAVIKSYLTEIGGYFAWDLHDGIYLYIPDEVVPKAARDIQHLLNHLPYKKAWGFEPPIPLPWDCKVGASWGSLKDYTPQ